MHISKYYNTFAFIKCLTNFSNYETNIIGADICQIAISILSLSLSSGINAEVKIVNGWECATPVRNVIVDDNTITVTYKISEIIETQWDSDNHSIFYSIPGFGHCQDIGKPNLPMKIDTFRVPDGFNVSISSIASDSIISEGNYIGVFEVKYENEAPQDVPHDIFKYEGVFPHECAKILTTYKLRNETLVEVLLCPIQYNLEKGRTIINSKITYTLTFMPDASKIVPLSREDNSIANRPYDGINITNFLPNSLVLNPNRIGGVIDSDAVGFEGYHM